jgi:hypothetical protein
MSEMLTVPTAFGDISDLTEGLADRVDGEQIILYGPTPYDEGAELDFSVLLLDGSPALEGRGRVEASVDGGEDRDPSTRFDIILGSLELGGVAEAVFERMLMARSLVGEGADEPVGEDAPVDEPMADDAPVDEPMADDAPVDEDAAAAEEPAVEEPAVEEPEEAVDSSEPAEASADDGWDAGESAFDDEATVVDDTLGFMEREAQAEAAAAAAAGAAAGDESIASADESAEAPAEEEEAAAAAPAVSPAIAIPTELFPADDAFRGAAPPAAPSDPGGFGVTNDLSGGLVRPVQQNTWTPVAPERLDPRPSSGLFQYGASIPLPSAPPRPDLDPSLVVTRAPHPGGSAAAVAYEAAPSVAYESVAEAAEAAFEDADVEADEYELEETE